MAREFCFSPLARWSGARTLRTCTTRAGEAEIGIWSMLDPRHQGKGRDETSTLEEFRPAEEALGERVKVLRGSPR